jgi:hypothetical protein
MNNEELKTFFTLKYGHPDLHKPSWILNLPNEILDILVPTKNMMIDGTNERHIKALTLFTTFNAMSVTRDASKRFEEYVFNRYIDEMRAQHRKAFVQKIKGFIK